MCALISAFSQNEVAEISTGLEQYLKSIAATGQTLYVFNFFLFIIYQYLIV